MRTRKLILADKLSNMRSIKKDYDALGDKLWERFNAGADKQKWYYGEMIKALDELKDYKETAECYEELQRNYNKVFGE